MHVIGVNLTVITDHYKYPQILHKFFTILRAVCKESHSDQWLSESKPKLTRITLRPEAERENLGAAHTQ